MAQLLKERIEKMLLQTDELENYIHRIRSRLVELKKESHVNETVRNRKYFTYKMLNDLSAYYRKTYPSHRPFVYFEYIQKLYPNVNKELFRLSIKRHILRNYIMWHRTPPRSLNSETFQL